MRGRKPIPTAIKADVDRTGYDRNGHKLPAGEPKPSSERPKKPKHLSASAAEEWDALVVALDELGILSATDRAALTLCAEHLGMARDAYTAMKTEGTTTQHANGTAGPTPYFGIYIKATAQARALLTEFGLTPSARPRVKTDKAGDDPGDFSDLDGAASK